MSRTEEAVARITTPSVPSAIALEALPPINRQWTEEDLQCLSIEELQLAHAMLEQRMYDIYDCYDEHVVFRQRRKKMGMKLKRLR